MPTRPLARMTAEAVLDRLQALSVFDRLVDAPITVGGFSFYTHAPYGEGRTHLEVFVRAHGEEHAIITSDPSAGHTLVAWVPSPDGKKVVYAMQEKTGITLTVIDTVTTHRLGDVVRNAQAPSSWSASGFFYSQVVAGTVEVMHHVLGTAQSRDTVVYKAALTITRATLQSAQGWQTLVLQHEDSLCDVLYREPRGVAFRPLQAGVGVRSVTMNGGDIYMRLADGEDNSHIVLSAAATREAGTLKEVVAAPIHALLVDAVVTKSYLVVHFAQHGVSRLELHALKGGWVRNLRLPDIGTVSDMKAGDNGELYYTFSSFNTPPEILVADVSTGVTTPWAKTALPITPADYATEQISYTTTVGDKAAMFLVHRRESALDGSVPLLMIDDIEESARFQPFLQPWLQMGGAYAMVVNDSAAAFKWLVANQYATATATIVTPLPLTLDNALKLYARAAP